MLRDLIVSGEAQRAQALVQGPSDSRMEWSNGAAEALDVLSGPHSSNARMNFFLMCQTFIELIR